MRIVSYIFLFLLPAIIAIGQQHGLVIEQGSPQLHLKGDLEAIRIDGKHRWINFVDKEKQLGFLWHEGQKMYLSNLQNGELYLRTNGTNQLTILPEGDIDLHHSLILGHNNTSPQDGMMRWNPDAHNGQGDFEGFMNGYWQSLTICSVTVCDRNEHEYRIRELEKELTEMRDILFKTKNKIDN